MARWLAPLCSLLLASCAGFEPARLVPAIALSPEELSISPSDSGLLVDFGLETAVNESDSLLAVEVLPGVRVVDVAANGPADSAGIRVGDVILAINRMETNSPDAVLALQRNAYRGEPYEFTLRRGTAVLSASVNGREIAANPGPRELYRVDPVATRAGYRTELIAVAGEVERAGARVVALFPGSPLPAAGIGEGQWIVALDGVGFGSAQELINRLNRDYELGAEVALDVWDGRGLRRFDVELWNPGTRVSRVSFGPLLQYRSSLEPDSASLDILDLWLFSVYSYSRNEGERSHSILGLFNFSTGYGELVEEAQ